jgi:hypothetical protein
MDNSFIARDIRQKMSNDRNRQKLYATILNLDDKNLLSFVTFDWVQAFGDIDEKGFRINSLFKPPTTPTNFTSFELLQQMSIINAFLIDLLGELYEIITIALLEPLRYLSMQYPPMVLHDVLSIAIRDLLIAEPLKSAHALDTHLIEWASVWGVNAPTGHFHREIQSAILSFQTSELLKVMALSTDGDRSKLSAGPNKGQPRKKPLTKNKTESKQPTSALTMSDLKGFCHKPLLGQPCPFGQGCRLKHQSDFDALTKEQQQDLKAKANKIKQQKENASKKRARDEVA